MNKLTLMKKQSKFNHCDDGWVGQIKIKDQLSPAEAANWAELGKIGLE